MIAARAPLQVVHRQAAELFATMTKGQRSLDRQAAALTDVLRAADLLLFVPLGPDGPSYRAAARPGGTGQVLRRSASGRGSAAQRAASRNGGCGGGFFGGIGGSVVNDTLPEEVPVVPLQARCFLSACLATCLPAGRPRIDLLSCQQEGRAGRLRQPCLDASAQSDPNAGAQNARDRAGRPAQQLTRRT
jgi:hypothetical protein